MRANQPLAAPRGRIAVLADGDAVRRRASAAHLRGLNVQVLEASDGPSMMQLVTQHAPEMVVLDVELPGIDLLGAVCAIRHNMRTGRATLTVIGQPATDPDLVRRLSAAGVTNILVRPVTRQLLEACAQAGHAGIATVAPPASATDAAPASSSRGTTLVSKAASNPYVLARPITCPCHEAQHPFARHSVRLSQVQRTVDYLDLPVYVAAERSPAAPDLGILEVMVCPRCLFTSINPAYFIHPQDPKHRAFAFPPAALEALRVGAAARMQLAQGVGATFLSENRTWDDGIVVYRLAAASATTLLQCDGRLFSIEAARLANYHLRLARLYERLASDPSVTLTRPAARPTLADVLAQYHTALESLRQACQIVEGVVGFRTIYQFVAVAVLLSQDELAAPALARLATFASGSALLPADQLALVGYRRRCEQLWYSRETHRFGMKTA